MKRHSFSAQELFCMAYLSIKRKMYGVPNGFDKIPWEERQAQMQNVIDSLIGEQVAVMDLDGKITLHSDYDALVRYLCQCEKCLTVNMQIGEQPANSLIFWSLNGNFLMAEVMGERYVFSEVEAPLIRGLLGEFGIRGRIAGQPVEAIVPQIALVKAKRMCKNEEYEEAIRILRQNGADEQLACVIADGLCEKASYVGLLYMDNRSGACQKAEKAYLSSRGITLALSQTVVNLRTCARFTGVEAAAAETACSKFVNAFLSHAV